VASQPVDFRKLNPSFQSKLDALKAKSGTAFDSAYVQEMKDIHAKDGAAFAKEASGGTNPGLKAFAAETRQIVLMHIGELAGIQPER
jgi:putative membrane protein